MCKYQLSIKSNVFKIFRGIIWVNCNNWKIVITLKKSIIFHKTVTKRVKVRKKRYRKER